MHFPQLIAYATYTCNDISLCTPMKRLNHSYLTWHFVQDWTLSITVCQCVCGHELSSKWGPYILVCNVWETILAASWFGYIFTCHMSFSCTLSRYRWASYMNLHSTARRASQVNAALGFSEGHWVQILFWYDLRWDTCYTPSLSTHCFKLCLSKKKEWFYSIIAWYQKMIRKHFDFYYMILSSQYTWTMWCHWRGYLLHYIYEIHSCQKLVLFRIER